MKRILLILIVGSWMSILLNSAQVLAFPEMVRSGYTNCTSCHVSPSGGGILTDYGRNLSSEVLSTWGSTKEAQVGHGILGMDDEGPGAGRGLLGIGSSKGSNDTSKDKDHLDQWLGVGGDIRAVQTYSNDENQRSGRFIWMQAMVDIAYRIQKWTAEISVGQFAYDGSGTWKPNAQQFYLLRQLNDENIIRVGRVLPQFGLNIPDHISPTRQTLGFGFGEERDLVEWNYIGENWNAAIGVADGPKALIPAEQSVYAQVQRAFKEHYKVGVSVWDGRSQHYKREIFAAHGMFGFTPHFYLLAEEDVQMKHPDGADSQTGFFGYYKLGYEIYKGMHALALFDHSQGDETNGKTLTRHWGAGFEFYPRPHFEISGAWTRLLMRSSSDQEGDYAYIVFHYYL